MPSIYCELQITPNHVSLVNSFCKLECTVRHSCFVTATHDNSCKRVCLLASSLLAVQVPLNSCQLMLPLSTYANSYQLTLTLVNAFLRSSTCINFFHLMLPLSTHDKSCNFKSCQLSSTIVGSRALFWCILNHINANTDHYFVISYQLGSMSLSAPRVYYLIICPYMPIV